MFPSLTCVKNDEVVLLVKLADGAGLLPVDAAGLGSSGKPDAGAVGKRNEVSGRGAGCFLNS